MSRLTILHINIIGVFVAIAVGVGLYFLFIPKARTAINQNQQLLASTQQTADTLPTAQSDLKKAVADKISLAKAYKVYEAQYMPTLGYNSNEVVTMLRVFMWNYGHNWPQRFKNAVFSFMNSQQRDNDITWIEGKSMTFGPFGIDPSTIKADAFGGGVSSQCQGYGPVLNYTMNMLVTGPSMNALLHHVQSWTKAKGIGVPTVSDVHMFRVYSTLFCRYTVNTTIILHETNPVYNPRISGTPSSAGGQAGGGMMGGMMGGPGMMGMSGPGGMGGPMSGMPGASMGGTPGPTASGTPH